MSSQVKSSQVKSSQVKSSQVKSSQVKSSQVKSALSQLLESYQENSLTKREKGNYFKHLLQNEPYYQHQIIATDESTNNTYHSLVDQNPPVTTVDYPTLEYNAVEWQQLANTYIEQIQTILTTPENSKKIAVFNEFSNKLRDDLNNAITDSEVVEMLAQHLITKPIFDALFANDSFTKHNPISKAMSKVMAILESKNLQVETKQLKEFYYSIQFRVSNIQSPEGKQKIIKKLYDTFFNKAFPKMAERLGIVYTPVEVVDFIIHSVEDVLKNEFNASLADKGVEILDPFTGTGTFITRLLQSGVIPLEKLPQKYHEIHANEIVLLAYYIAAINIESVYHSLIKTNEKYTPFNGICLTDTFQLYEKENFADQNSIKNPHFEYQKTSNITVIMGNPPYSINDNNAKTNYPQLDRKIENTYSKYSKSNLQKSIYDSYIRAIRWASDRIKHQGVIGFITSSGFIYNNSTDGLRKCLAEEFSSLYIFDMRGNSRTSEEKARKEGGNIFDIRTPTAISILVKNPHSNSIGNIYYYNIGDYLKKDQKLQRITELHSINGISQQNLWQRIIPDQFNDWLNKRDPNFDTYIPLGDKKSKDKTTIFKNYSLGIASNRDAWIYNFSKNKLAENMASMIAFYNQQVRYFIARKEDETYLSIDDVIDFDPTKISWGETLKMKFRNLSTFKFQNSYLSSSLYRPYTKSHFYYDKNFIERIYQIPKIFPNAETENKVICLTVTGTKGFSVLMSNLVPDLHLIGDTQCFPLYLYKETDQAVNSDDLFANLSAKTTAYEGYQRREAITDEALEHFSQFYNEAKIRKEDIFYYIYGLLHSEEYREKYADNLSKQLPRIPRVKNIADFWTFSQAGRDLAELHLHYETVPMYKDIHFKKGNLKIKNNRIIGGIRKDFYVEKMKFIKKEDKTAVVYNKKFTLENIPLEAYDYIVNGKPALEWVMERQSIKTDKASGIINNANDWAIETMNNPRYPMELFLRVVTVSLETMKIVNRLPPLFI